jgi:hypothetical protein
MGGGGGAAQGHGPVNQARASGAHLRLEGTLEDDRVARRQFGPLSVLALADAEFTLTIV